MMVRSTLLYITLIGGLVSLLVAKRRPGGDGLVGSTRTQRDRLRSVQRRKTARRAV